MHYQLPSCLLQTQRRAFDSLAISSIVFLGEKAFSPYGLALFESAANFLVVSCTRVFRFFVVFADVPFCSGVLKRLLR